MTSTAHLINVATATFGDLLAEALPELPPYRMARHWIKADARREHIVARFDSDVAPSLILKQAFAPQDATEFAGIVKNHEAAQAALSGQTDVTVPELLAIDPSRQAYLMRFVAGETLLDACRTSDDHRPLLRQAGRWLAGYHAGTFQEDRVFQPKFMANHMLHLADQMKTGVRRIKGQKRFLALTGHIQDWVAPCSGQQTKVAAKHGDLNAHNILVSPDSVAALDFLAHSHAPVGYDIARILLSYMQMVGDLAALPKGHVVPPDVLDAFFEVYGFVPPDDPGVTFMLRVQILTDWNRFNHSLSVSAALRFQRLRFIANRAFA